MNSHEHSRTGIQALDQFGASFDLVLRDIDEREAQANVVALPARPKRARLAAAFAAAAAVVVAGVALAYSLLAGGGALSTDQAIANIAGAASVQTLPPDDAYTVTRARVLDSQALIAEPNPGDAVESDPITFFVSTERQSWLSIARAGIVQSKRLGVTFATEADEQAAASRLRLGDPESSYRYPAAGAYRIGEGSYTRAELEQFPTDPQAIYDRLGAEIKVGDDADREFAMWRALTEPLTSASPPLPPELRSGLVGAIGLLPSIKTLGDTATARGDEGIGFELSTIGTRDKIVFDAATSAVLFSESKIVDARIAKLRGVPVNTVLHRFELLDQKVSQSLPKA